MFKLKLNYSPTNHTQAGITSARPCIFYLPTLTN